MDLENVEHWFLDLDGTVYLDEEPLPGALELIAYFRRQGIGYTFLTNNSSRSALEYLTRLRRLRFEVDDDQVFTSGGATASYLQRELPGASVYVLGTPALAAELSSRGIQVVEDDPDVILLGFDPSLSYSRLAKACNLLSDGRVRYLATNPDANCPVRGGFLPDAGAVMALIEVSAERRPEAVIGKPNPQFIREIAGRVGADLERSAMVGDRLETDMTMAQAVGIPGVLVLSGTTKVDDPRLQDLEQVTVAGGLDALFARLSDRG